MKNQHILKIFFLIALTPLFAALFFAFHDFFDWQMMSNRANAFSRISSYIYAHYTGALVLALTTGMQIGNKLNKNQFSPKLIFHLSILVALWLSYGSFGDFQGVLLIFFCWVANMLMDLTSLYQNKKNDWLVKFNFKINTMVVLILFLILLINQ